MGIFLYFWRIGSARSLLMALERGYWLASVGMCDSVRRASIRTPYIRRRLQPWAQASDSVGILAILAMASHPPARLAAESSDEWCRDVPRPFGAQRLATADQVFATTANCFCRHPRPPRQPHGRKSLEAPDPFAFPGRRSNQESIRSKSRPNCLQASTPDSSPRIKINTRGISTHVSLARHNACPTVCSVLDPPPVLACSSIYTDLTIRSSIEFLALVDNPILHKIISYLDSTSLVSLASSCPAFHHYAGYALTNLLVPIQTRSLVTGPVPTTVPASSSPSGSASSSRVEYDSVASTDSEIISSPEEEEWEFQVTPDMMRRLSLLPRRNHGSTLPSLPTELQLEIFSYLDKIDSCCLGLTSRSSYLIYRAIHGTKMPLNTRRIGPNKLEAAWEVVGKQECSHCGMYRCELHEHIKSWMPMELEYCAMKQNFGLPAPRNAHANCYRGKPSKPKRCGRHPLRTTSIHQDDAQFKH